MDRLPLELFPFIFSQTLTPVDCHADNDSWTWLCHADERTRLSLVCRGWKDLVMSTPELWTLILIDEHSTLQRTQQWLTRAKDRPLYIVVVFWYDDIDDDGGEFDEEVAAVTTKAHQWASLRLHGGHLDEDQMHAMIPKELPRLLDAAIVSGLDMETFKPSQSAPNLCHLSIQGDSSEPFMFLDCTHLRRVQITAFCDYGWQARWDQFFAYLSEMCPALEVLEIEQSSIGCGVFEGDVEEHEETMLPTLRELTTLSMRACCPYTLAHILPRLHAPNLNDIHLLTIGKAKNLRTPIALPMCQKVHFTYAQVSGILSFISKISNIADISIEVDFVSALTLSMTAKDSYLNHIFGLDHTLGPTSMLLPFVQICGITKVDWAIAPHIIVSGPAEVATFGAAMEGMNTWRQWVTDIVIDCHGEYLCHSQIFERLKVFLATNRRLNSSEEREVFKKYAEFGKAVERWQPPNVEDILATHILEDLERVVAKNTD